MDGKKVEPLDTEDQTPTNNSARKKKLGVLVFISLGGLICLIVQCVAIFDNFNYATDNLSSTTEFLPQDEATLPASVICNWNACEKLSTVNLSACPLAFFELRQCVDYSTGKSCLDEFTPLSVTYDDTVGTFKCYKHNEKGNLKVTSVGYSGSRALIFELAAPDASLDLTNASTPLPRVGAQVTVTTPEIVADMDKLKQLILDETNYFMPKLDTFFSISATKVRKQIVHEGEAPEVISYSAFSTSVAISATPPINRTYAAMSFAYGSLDLTQTTYSSSYKSSQIVADFFAIFAAALSVITLTLYFFSRLEKSKEFTLF